MKQVFHEPEPNARTVNDRIRRALAAAAEAEEARERFSISGRGHEPRVTLDRRLAQVVRALGLPCVYIGGFGANKHYPHRIFARAAKELEQDLGWAPISVSAWKAALTSAPLDAPPSKATPELPLRANTRAVRPHGPRPLKTFVSDS